MATTVVKTTVDSELVEKASAVFAAAGLTLSEAVRMMLLRTVAEHAVPFDPLVPNVETVEAMHAARRGEVVGVGGIDDLIADLHAED